jgi:WD40 repeat protein
MTRSPVTSIEFHPDGLILAVGMQDGNIEIYDVRKKEPQLTFQAIKEGCAV